MNGKNKWLLFTINFVLGGMYIAAILFLIGWVADGQMGLEGFLIPFGLIILLIYGWILTDTRKNAHTQYHSSPLTDNELS